MIIDSEATSEPFLSVNQGNGNMVFTWGDPDYAGGTMYTSRHLNSTESNGPFMKLLNDDENDDQPILTMDQDGTGIGLYLDIDGTGAAIHIDSESTADPAIKFTSGTNGGCATGDYGFYTNATGHPYYCLNGVAKVVTLS